MLERSAKFLEMERTIDRLRMQIREMDSSLQENTQSVVSTNAKMEVMAAKQDRTLDMLAEMQRTLGLAKFAPSTHFSA